MHRPTPTATLLLLLGCTHANATGASQSPPAHKVVTLSLPRPATANDLVRAHITIGPLPRGARIIARLPSGQIVGTISPYGTLKPDLGGAYTIAIPAHGVRDGKVTLHLEMREKRNSAPRPPTEREVEKVELQLMPATR